MTKYIKDDIWNVYQDYDAICCTTNSVVSKDHYGKPSLVMGGGIALAFSEKFPKIRSIWGEHINKRDLLLKDVGIIITDYIRYLSLDVNSNKIPYLIYLQTKRHFQDKSDVDLIRLSLLQLCAAINMHGWNKVLLPKPGCALGGLNWNTEVYPVIKDLLESFPQIDIIEKD